MFPKFSEDCCVPPFRYGNRNAGGIMTPYAWGRSGLLNDKSRGLIFVWFVTFIRITSMLSGIRFN
jgi:hypothetical protein